MRGRQSNNRRDRACTETLPRIDADDRGSGKGRNSPRRRGDAEENTAPEKPLTTKDTEEHKERKRPKGEADHAPSGHRRNRKESYRGFPQMNADQPVFLRIPGRIQDDQIIAAW